MKHTLTIVVGTWLAVGGLCMAQSGNNDPKEVVFEGKSLRSWLKVKSSADGAKATDPLFRFCAKPEVALPALTAALTDNDADVRQAAVYCLGGYFVKEKDCKATIPLLLKALQEDKSSAVRMEAVFWISRFGSDNNAVRAALLKALKEDESDDVRAKVIIKLIDIKSPDVLPAIVKAAKEDKEIRIRCEAVGALAEVGDGKTVIPMLIDRLSSVDKQEVIGPGYKLWSVSDSAAQALSERCPEAVPALLKALKDKNAQVRGEALSALAHAAESVMPVIQKKASAIVPLLDDKDEITRSDAARLLGRIKAKEAVLALAAKLDDEDVAVRYRCIEALGRIGPDAAAAVEKLTGRLKDPRPDLRCDAAKALGDIGPKAKAAVPVLIEALDDKENKALRLAAIDALGNIGPDAKAAVPKLKEALKSDNKRLQRSAKDALEKIGAE